MAKILVKAFHTGEERMVRRRDRKNAFDAVVGACEAQPEGLPQLVPLSRLPWLTP